MKKLIPSLLLAAFACSSAYAASSSMQLTSGGTTTVTADTDGCLILATSVGVGLSQNVHGSVYCREADGTDVSMIAAGTCHAAGLSKTRSVVCINKGTENEPNYYPTDCTSADGTASVEVNGPSLFMLDTATGGSMSESALGNVCDGTNVQAYVDAEAADL